MSAAVVAVVVIVIYNGFVGKRNAVRFAFAGIDVQLKKRFDLIPNLVSAVKAYMQHERETLERITALRARAVAEGTPPSEQLRLFDQLTPVIHGIVAQVENYPQLRASEQFQLLQRNLSEVEEQLSAARRAYNAAVTEYNTSLQVFPGNVFAALFGFKPTDLFSVADAERTAPRVKDRAP
ncbi:MAG: LemA family protein [Kiritimatiellaeota bacterium]|nr:LemA family protein [Kiritimatiellota bacterium]